MYIGRQYVHSRCGRYAHSFIVIINLITFFFFQSVYSNNTLISYQLLHYNQTILNGQVNHTAVKYVFDDNRKTQLIAYS